MTLTAVIFPVERMAATCTVSYWVSMGSPVDVPVPVDAPADVRRLWRTGASRTLHRLRRPIRWSRIRRRRPSGGGPGGRPACRRRTGAAPARPSETPSIASRAAAGAPGVKITRDGSRAVGSRRQPPLLLGGGLAAWAVRSRSCGQSCRTRPLGGIGRSDNPRRPEAGKTGSLGGGRRSRSVPVQVSCPPRRTVASYT